MSLMFHDVLGSNPFSFRWTWSLTRRAAAPLPRTSSTGPTAWPPKNWRRVRRRTSWTDWCRTGGWTWYNYCRLCCVRSTRPCFAVVLLSSCPSLLDHAGHSAETPVILSSWSPHIGSPLSFWLHPMWQHPPRLAITCFYGTRSGPLFSCCNVNVRALGGSIRQVSEQKLQLSMLFYSFLIKVIVQGPSLRCPIVFH